MKAQQLAEQHLRQSRCVSQRQRSPPKHDEGRMVISLTREKKTEPLKFPFPRLNHFWQSSEDAYTLQKSTLCALDLSISYLKKYNLRRNVLSCLVRTEKSTNNKPP